MDISKETDLNKLKALAYDELARREQADNNLRIINQRIADLNRPKAQKPKKDK